MQCSSCSIQYEINLLEANEELYTICPICGHKEKLPEELKVIYPYENYSDT